MIKKVLWTAGIILGVCVIYVYVLPMISAGPQYVEEPEICEAICDFANEQMKGKVFEIPRNAEKWLVENVLIHKLEDLPGPHNRKMVKATVQGSYWTDQGEYRPLKQKAFKSKVQFNIGNKYPEGISVQHIH